MFVTKKLLNGSLGSKFPFITSKTTLLTFKIVQKLIDQINGVTRENLTGIRVIRAFNADEYQMKRFDNVNDKLTDTQLFKHRCFAILSPIMNLVMPGLTLGIYSIGAYLIYNV